VSRIGRLEKGKRIARFLTGVTGLIGLNYQYHSNEVSVPKPHRVTLSTHRSNELFMQMVRKLGDEEGMPVVVRYDGDYGSVDEATVSMTLRTYAEFLSCWSQAHNEGRQ
jgi:hypothetical protein